MPIPAKFGGTAPYAIRGTTSLRLANVGGVVFAGGTLQNNRVFDATWGVLNSPYLGLHSGKSENHNYGGSPFLHGGVIKGVSAGTFGVLTRGHYVILTYNTQIAGVATNVIKFAASAPMKSENRKNRFVNTLQTHTTGGWYYVNGQPVLATLSRDDIKLDLYPGSRAVPGRITYLAGSLVPTTSSFPAKTS